MHSYYRVSFGYGITFGNALAMAISFPVNHSVFWTIVDGLLSWLYVLYYLLRHA